ncbi:MAG: hypothetical protein RRA92_00060 [Gemmatimonadota bacterium]|nr:hypothetical protein [Gemmatimonadota bacterium]
MRALDSPSLLSDRKARHRRILAVSMAVSGAVHLALFLWATVQVGVRDLSSGPLLRPARAVEGIVVVEVRPLTPEESAERLERERRIEVEREPLAPLAPEPAAEEGGAAEPVPSRGRDDEGRGLTNAEKLRPREGDERLWKDYRDEPLPEYLGDRWARAEGAIRARLSQALDSLRLTEEQRRKAVEWLTGEGDDQWGVTPEGIVLGGVVIPLNVGSLLAEEGPRGREARAVARDLESIRRQDFREDVETTLEERNRAIEERMAAERAAADSAAQADSLGSSP